jgi:hypothetical protein
VLEETEKIEKLKHWVQQMLKKGTPGVEEMKSLRSINKQAKSNLATAETMMKLQTQRLVSPKDKHTLEMLEKDVQKSRISLKRASQTVLEIARFFQDSAQAAVREAKVQLEQNVFNAKADELGVNATLETA